MIEAIGEFLAVLKEAPTWLRLIHYGWILLALVSVFMTMVWFTSPSNSPIRVKRLAELRQPAGIPLQIQMESMDTIKKRVADLQEKGMSAMTTGDLDTAARSFRNAQLYLDAAIIRAPQDLFVQNLRGYMLKDWAEVALIRGEEAEAVRLINEAESTFRLVIKQDNNDASAHNGLGSVYAIRGDLKNAEVEIRKALELEPDYRDAKLDLELVKQLQRERH